MPMVARLKEGRSHPANLERWLIRAFGGTETSSGVQVDHDSALSATAILDGVRMISQDVARVPLNLYRRKKPRGKEVARNEPLHDVLHANPNPEQTSLEMREMVTAFAVLMGTGFAQVRRDRGGRVAELWPVPTHRVRPTRTEAGKLVWVVRVDGEGVPMLVPADEMLVVRGFGLGGVLGLDVVEKMRESIGLTLATERFGSAFFGNGSHPGGVIEVPNVLSDKAYAHLKESWEEKHRGTDNAHRVALLEEGSKWVQTSVAPEAAQFLETRKFQVTEVARVLNIPPHKLKDLERATFSNIEHQAIDYVTGSLGPWYNRWEQACTKWLLTPRERETLFVEHVIEGLLRGDIKTRFEAYAIGRQNGWYSPNDVREKENEDPIPEGGDDYHVQVNLVRVQDLEKVTEANVASKTSPEAPPAEEDARYRRAWERSLLATAKVAVTREVGRLRAVVRRACDADSEIVLRRGIDEVYERHEAWLAETFEPWFESHAEAHDFARREAAGALAELRAILKERPGENPVGSVEARLEEWETEKAAQMVARTTNDKAKEAA